MFTDKWLVYKKVRALECSNQFVGIYKFKTRRTAIKFIKTHISDVYRCPTSSCTKCNNHHFTFDLARIKNTFVGK